MGVYRSKKVYLGAWHYVGLTILYAIPVIGWIIAAVHAADHNKENRLHYARFFLIRLAAAVVIVGASCVRHTTESSSSVFSTK